MPRVDTDTFYRNAIDRYGRGAEGVHWESARAQRTRFAVLRRLLPDDLSGLTLADVGCGMGDLFRFLEVQGDRPAHYIGIDVVEPMIEIARLRAEGEFLMLDALHDPLPAADWYLCSGAMNTLTRDETRRFIERCLAAARAGFVFNLLHGVDDCHTFNYWEPQDIAALAAELGVDCAIATGYLFQDFSATLRHPGVGGGRAA